MKIHKLNIQGVIAMFHNLLSMIYRCQIPTHGYYKKLYMYKICTFLKFYNLLLETHLDVTFNKVNILFDT